MEEICQKCGKYKMYTGSPGTWPPLCDCNSRDPQANYDYSYQIIELLKEIRDILKIKI